jgi:methionine biosynthesis protein MetW
MQNWITDKDLERTYSSHIIPDILKVIAKIKEKNQNVDRILDLGCGYGGILKLIGHHLGANELNGIDIDTEAVNFAKQRGINAITLDLEYEKLPYEDSSFDFVFSLGVFDYFKFWDNVILEIRCVLKVGGYVMISLPNLASWYNRIALLLGYQPRDIEVSRYYLVGVYPFYKKRGDSVVGHVHTITAFGFKELMEKYGFETLILTGANTITAKVPKIFKIINTLLKGILPANLSKRFIYLGRKTTVEPEAVQSLSWWQNFYKDKL